MNEFKCPFEHTFQEYSLHDDCDLCPEEVRCRRSMFPSAENAEKTSRVKVALSSSYWNFREVRRELATCDLVITSNEIGGYILSRLLGHVKILVVPRILDEDKALQIAGILLEVPVENIDKVTSSDLRSLRESPTDYHREVPAFLENAFHTCDKGIELTMGGQDES